MALFEGGDNVYDIEEGGVEYRVHEFLSSGTLVCVEPGEIEYLVVAGGGGGGQGSPVLPAGGRRSAYRHPMDHH